MNALSVAIEESGLRKDWIAAQLGIGPWALSRYIKGSGPGARVERSNQLALAILLRRSVDSLFDEDGYARLLPELVGVGPAGTDPEVEG